MQAKKPQWATIASAVKAANPIARRRPVFLRLGDAFVQVRTFAPDGKDAFVGNVESICDALPAGSDVQLGDWVRFETKHVFSACVLHE